MVSSHSCCQAANTWPDSWFDAHQHFFNSDPPALAGAILNRRAPSTVDDHDPMKPSSPDHQTSQENSYARGASISRLLHIIGQVEDVVHFGDQQTHSENCVGGWNEFEPKPIWPNGIQSILTFPQQQQRQQQGQHEPLTVTEGQVGSVCSSSSSTMAEDTSLTLFQLEDDGGRMDLKRSATECDQSSSWFDDEADLFEYESINININNGHGEGPANVMFSPQSSPTSSGTKKQRLNSFGGFNDSSLLFPTEHYPLLGDRMLRNADCVDKGSIASSSCGNMFRLGPSINTQKKKQNGSARFRKHQADQWVERFEDLVKFKAKHGHCLVPHNYAPNQQLSQWTKRQRYQYKLKMKGDHSTLTDARQQALESMGFIWDSHKAAWEERFEALKQFRAKHGNCMVPTSYKDRSLAAWVKCQRRGLKLFRRGLRSSMNEERFEQLNSIGFEWNPRNMQVWE